MTRDEAIQIARTLAEKEGWPWAEPLLVEEGRRFALFGRRYWRVTTNTKYVDIGHNVHVQIDDQTRRVLSSEYVPTLTFGTRPSGALTAASHPTPAPPDRTPHP